MRSEDQEGFLYCDQMCLEEVKLSLGSHAGHPPHLAVEKKKKKKKKKEGRGDGEVRAFVSHCLQWFESSRSIAALATRLVQRFPHKLIQRRVFQVYPMPRRLDSLQKKKKKERYEGFGQWS